MTMICNDSVFGEMSYKYRWHREREIDLFGKTWIITLAVQAYSGKPINDNQRESYQKFKSNINVMINDIENELVKYINVNIQELAVYWNGVKLINSPKELVGVLAPKTLLIKEDGTIVILFDNAWDDRGIGVKILPQFMVGLQEVFL